MTKRQLNKLDILTGFTILSLWVIGCTTIIIGTMETYNGKEKLEHWTTDVTYVDIETGEVIEHEIIRGVWTRQPMNDNYRYGDYTIINKFTKYEKVATNTGRKYLRYECRRTK